MTDELTEKDPVVARNEKVVRRFLDAWAALDVEGAMACLAPNIVYINQPLEPVVGLANVRRIIQGILTRPRESNGNCSTSLGAAAQFVPSGWTVGTSTARDGA
jgi:ketosteroid isomerase-like protein